MRCQGAQKYVNVNVAAVSAQCNGVAFVFAFGYLFVFENRICVLLEMACLCWKSLELLLKHNEVCYVFFAHRLVKEDNRVAIRRLLF